MEDIGVLLQSTIKVESEVKQEVKQEQENICGDFDVLRVVKTYSRKLKPPVAVWVSEDTEVSTAEEEVLCAQKDEDCYDPLFVVNEEEKSSVCGQHMGCEENHEPQEDIHTCCKSCVDPNNTHMNENPHSYCNCKHTLLARDLPRVLDTLSHIRSQTKAECFVCSMCEMKFSYKSALTRHIRTHSGEKPFACTMCEMKFFRKEKLKQHFRTHTGEKPYPCSFCQMKFSQKVSLNNHVKKHTGEKPYECSVCVMKFVDKFSLTRHLRTHTGEKPYACTMCKKKFSQSGSLRLHIRTHTGEKPYQCSICKMNFSRRTNLLSHLRIHKGE